MIKVAFYWEQICEYEIKKQTTTPFRYLISVQIFQLTIVHFVLGILVFY